MLISRQELAFDFEGARFDLSDPVDRSFLAWVFNQFLYGEVTGIQCGHWLYRAPHLSAATFLAKQASEELSHVRKILRILSLIGEPPRPAHAAIRFLSTGMMGGSWGEHVTLEMALGEGLVLSAFYALADTIEHPEIHRLLESAITEEERHVVFGERETQAWLAEHPGDREFLLAQAVLQTWALQKLKGFISRRMIRGGASERPVLKQFERFYDHVIERFERRTERLGLSAVPLRSMSGWKKTWLVASLPFRKIRRWVVEKARPRPLLTATYLKDPILRSESERFAET